MPISSDEFVQQIEKYIKPPNKQYREALALFNRVLLSKLGDLTPEVLERALSEVHTIVLHLPDDDDAKALYSSVVKELSKLSDPDKVLCLFYQRVSQTYLSLQDDTNAVSYISSALCLAEERKLLPLLDGIKKEIEGLYSFFMRKSLLPVWKELLPEQIRLLGSQKEPPLERYLRFIAELCHGEEIYSKDAYTIVEPLISLWFSWAETPLKRTHQLSLDAFSETVEKLLPIVQLFEAHHQWERALKLYYAILKSCRLEAEDYDNKHAIEDAIGAVIHYQQETKKPPTFVIHYRWRSWRDRLKECRETLHERLMAKEEVLIAQAAFTKDIRILLSDIVDAIALQLGEPPSVNEASGATHPCGFTVLGLGSLSRSDFCPYSDVDIALLIEDGSLRDHPYFQALVRLFELNVNLAGEKGGFVVDEADIKYLTEGKKSHLDTPENLVKCYHPSVHIEKSPSLLEVTHSLHTSVPIYANESGQFLFAEYQRLLENAYNTVLPDKKMTVSRQWALEHLANQSSSHPSALSEEKKTSIDLKTFFLRPLTMWCYDMVLYFNGFSRKQSLITLLEQLTAHFDKEFLIFFRQVLSDCQYERVMQQFNVKKQPVFLENLSSEEQASWERLYNLCIRVLLFISQEKYLEESASPFHPILHYIEVICKGLFSAEEKEKFMLPDERDVFKYFIEHLIHQKAPAEQHQAIYQRLSKYTTAHHLREDYIHYLREDSTLESSFIDYLETFPDQAGQRISVDRARKRWRDDLQKILWPKSKEIPPGYEKLPVIDLHSATGGHCILHPAVVQQLLEQHCIDDKGQIRPKKEHRPELKGRHTVMRIDITIEGERIQLYLKVFPEMPGMEIFASEMARRIAGYGASFVDLVRWRAGKKAEYDYPILISHGLAGPGLETLLQDTMVETLKQLDLYHLGMLTLFEMLIGSEDAKPDNFVVQMPQEGSKNRMLTLASFDRERSGYPPAFYEENGELIPLIKNVVFCLEHMNKSIDPRARAAFLSLDAYTVLDAVLEEGQHFTAVLERLYTPTEILRVFEGQGVMALFNRMMNQPLIDVSILPIPLREGFIKECYGKLCWLQNQLRREEKENTYFTLYQGIEPYLGHWYQSLYEKYKTPLERFNQGPRQYYPEEPKKAEKKQDETPTALQTGPQTLQTMHGKPVKTKELDTYRSYWMKEVRTQLKRIHEEYQTCDRIRVHLENGERKELNALSNLPVDLVETILAKVGKLSVEFQREVVDILLQIQKREKQFKGMFSFKRLIVKNNLALSRKDLYLLLSGSWQLYKLDLRGCRTLDGMNEYFIPFLLSQTANLESLNLSDLPNVQRLGVGNHPTWFFPELKTLRLNHCENLEDINIRAPKLKWLEVNDCKNLKSITLLDESPSLKGLFCKECIRLENVTIHAPHLEIGDFADCYRLSFTDLDAFRNPGILSLQQLKLKDGYALNHWDAKDKTKLAKLKEILIPDSLKRFGILNTSGEVIEKIVCRNRKIDDIALEELIEFLKNNRTVKEVDLSGNLLTDKSIDALISLTHENQALCEIHLGDNNFTVYADQKAKTLKKFLSSRFARWQVEKIKASEGTITKIDWNNKEITDVVLEILIEFLKNNKTVRKVDLSGNLLTDKSIDALMSLLQDNKTIFRIDVSSNQIIDKKRVIELQNILSSRFARWQVEKIKASEGTITKIDWNNKEITDVGLEVLIEFLKSNRTVKEVDLSGNLLTDESIDTLISLLQDNETIFRIDVNSYAIIDKKRVIELQNILGARFAHCQVEKIKASEGTITKIDCNNKKITDVGLEVLIEFLKSNRTVKEVDLSGNLLTDESPGALISLAHENQALSEIHLGNNGFRVYADRKAKTLKKFLSSRFAHWQVEKIKASEGTTIKIDWYNKQIADVDLEVLIEFLKNNKTVRKIDLSGNLLTDKSIDTLISLLQDNETIFRIDLSSNEIIDKKKVIELKNILGARFVRWQIEKIKASEGTVKKIDWNSKQIPDVGLEVLIEFLKNNKTVEEVDLRRNLLTDKSIDALMSLLQDNKTIFRIDVSSNQIIDKKRVIELQNILSSRFARWQVEKIKASEGTITKIDWNRKEVGDVGVKVLVDFLMKNNTVKEVALSGNLLTEEGIDSLLWLLQRNEMITLIDVSKNYRIKDDKRITELERILLPRITRWQLEKIGRLEYPRREIEKSPQFKQLIDSERGNGLLFSRLYTVIIYGATFVGKSAWLRRLTTGIFSSDEYRIGGVDFESIILRRLAVKLTVWDIAGDYISSYRILNNSYTRGKHTFIFSFDVTDNRTLEDIQVWNSIYAQSIDKRIPKILVGFKVDLLETKQADTIEAIREKAIHLLMKIGASAYIECSPKSDINVDTIAYEAANICLHKELFPESLLEPRLFFENGSKIWLSDYLLQYPFLTRGYSTSSSTFFARRQKTPPLDNIAKPHLPSSIP